MNRIATCLTDLSVSGSRVQLMPAGEFSARDGRPGRGRKWRIDGAGAARLIAAAAARKTPYVIDYEHQTLNAEKNGRPAPAAGWFTRLEWDPATGLHAADVAWTEKAKAMIAAGEYKFISPVFSYGPDGSVLALHMAALTNHPAIDGMEMLAAATFKEEKPMNSEILKLLGLVEDADEAAARAAIAALKTEADTARSEIAALKTEADTARSEIAALKSKAAAPDPEKYVPAEAVAALRSEIAALKRTAAEREVESLMAEGLADGRIPPSLEAWARSLGAKDAAALKAFLDAAAPMPEGTQTGGRAPSGEPPKIGPEALAVCRALEIPAEEYLKQMKGDDHGLDG